MPEHTIPASLVERIKDGRAALVIGAGIGVSTWKQLLERMNQELIDRGQEGDEAAHKDVAKLLHKGSLVRAAGFLARALGEEACDRIAQEMWATPPELPAVVKSLATLPIRQAWTTFPGTVIEQAMVDELPADWPTPSVVTYGQIESLDRRRRYLLKLLGDFETYVVTPKSVRRALAKRDELRSFIAEMYEDGALIFVGFRYGDPDLAALLDRVFGQLEPPESDHYLVASGVGPVTVDELMAEHHIDVINLPGKGVDDEATAALIEWLESLRDACEAEGITLAQTRPDADDLEGWIGVLADDPHSDEGIAAVDAILADLRDRGDAEALIEGLMLRTEVEPVQTRRAALLREVAQVFQDQLGDLPKAFTALTAALREDPSDMAALDAAEQLAAETDAWTELITDVSEIANAIEDAPIAAAYWSRLGKWYDERLHHFDYAIAAYREALKRDAERLDAHAGLEEVYRKQQRWAELAEELETHVGLEPRADLYLALGDLYENQLASTAKAIDAYQAAADVDDENQDALAALERLYRRAERWGKLARVLERRAELFEREGETQRAGVVRHELGQLRADKLGDLEGAIARYEAQLETNPADLDTLRALLEMYEKSGRADAALRTVERMVDVVPDSERVGLLRRLGVELAEQESERDRAIGFYERVLELEPNAEDAYRALERLLRAQARWYDLVGILERHIGAVHAPAPRVQLFSEMARVYEQELEDPHRAIEAHLNAVSIQEDHAESLEALVRLYTRVEAYDRAADTLVKHAQQSGAGGAQYWHQAGELAVEHLADPDQATAWFEKALELHPNYLPAMLSIARLHKKRRNWGSAVARLREAEQHSQNRLERVELLAEASDIAEERLEDPALALELQRRILELDPDHQEAGIRVSERLVAEQRWEEAEPILEMLARRADDDDRVEKARREALLGRACAESGKGEKAAKHFALAVEADPDSLDAALGLADMKYRAAQAGDDTEAWAEVDRRYRELLARHRTNLADGQVVETWHRLGVASRALGDDKKADNAFRRALERDPHHRSSLTDLIDIAEAREDWKTVVEAKRDMMEGADDEERMRLFEEIGDTYAKKLGDPVTALGAYLEVTKMDPTNHVVLHKCLDIYSEQKQWRRAIETLGAIAATEANPKRRAKYRYAAAVIARDEVGDVDVAVDNFNQALDDDAAIPKAFDAIDRLLEDKQDWRNLARAYRKMLKRVGEEAPSSQLIKLWSRLGDICLDHLDDNEAAIAAYEVASSLDPDNVDRHEQLANLYLEAGHERRDDAIAELQILIQAYPDRVELYRALSDLYREAGDGDKAFCLAQALVFLGAATDDERALFDQYRPKALKVAKRRLTEELWQKAIIHTREDRHLNAVFSSLVASLAATTAQPPSAFKLPSNRRANTQTDSHTAARVFGYAANILGLEPAPTLYVDPSAEDALRVANTAEKGKLQPSVLMGGPLLSKDGEGELAFDVGKKLAYFRPERYVTYALQTLPKMEVAVKAALTAAGVRDLADDMEVKQLADHIKKTTPGALLDQVNAVGKSLAERAQNGLVAGWRSATDLTANRVGLILCNDFETAARVIATEAPGISTIAAKDRLRDLLAYSVSEPYFQVRRHLGLTIQE